MNQFFCFRVLSSAPRCSVRESPLRVESTSSVARALNGRSTAESRHSPTGRPNVDIRPFAVIRSTDTMVPIGIGEGMKPPEMNGLRKKDWTLRKASVADAKALSACMRAAYASYSLRLTNETLPPLTVNYEDEIRAYPAWVAESDGRLVGGLILMPEKNYLTVANVAVHPQFQGNGLGRGFMDLTEAEAKQRGYTELRLATHVAMPENISLYSHLGWSETHRDESRVYMQKRLV